MAKLQIKTNLSSVVVCGEFCNWDIMNAMVVTKEKGKKNIIVEKMPIGEYKVFQCKDFNSSEKCPICNLPRPNRRFDGKKDEVIQVIF